MKVLITGVCGFVGSSLARTLVDRGFSVVGVDDLSFGAMSRLSDFIDKIEFHNVPFEIYSDKKHDDIDALINCAAVAPLPENQRDHYRCLRLNVALCGAVIDFCTLNGIKKIIHFSSSAVYENGPSSITHKRPAYESDLLEPRLAYPVSKYLSEEYLRTQAESYGLEVYALRLFNLYGPHQDYFRKQPPLIGYLIRSLLRGEPVDLFASEGARRDYIYIDDLLELLVILFETDGNQGFVPLNVGSGKCYSVYDILTELENVLETKARVSKGDSGQFWINYPELFDRKIPLSTDLVRREVEKKAISDISRVHKLAGWAPKISMREGLRKCAEFAREVVL
ncbi:MAG TPA: hypothetical protein DEX20_01230 [Halieaceae bacterium]|nr:hypothetical protein [Halieaceae bacterium]